MAQLEQCIGKIIAAFFLLAMLGLGAQPQAAELKPANVRMDFIIGGKHAPWFVALEKGFYAKRGLNVTIQSSTGSADTVRTIGAGGAEKVIEIELSPDERSALGRSAASVRSLVDELDLAAL